MVVDMMLQVLYMEDSKRKIHHIGNLVKNIDNLIRVRLDWLS